MKCLRLLRFATVLSMAAWASVGLAGKPATNDPVRKELVQVIRQHPAFKDTLQGWRMDIRQLRVEGDWAYVCALLIDPQGQHQHSEGMVNVQQIVLKRVARAVQVAQKADSGWMPVARVEGLSENARDVQCLSDERGQITPALLEGLANNPALQPKLHGGSP